MRTVNLCFHGIGRPRRVLEQDEARYWITEELFERILDDVVERPEVRLSFDDGNASDVDIALKALLERGLTATFFVLAGRIGTPGSLGEADIQELARRGMRVGTHGMHHQSWRGLKGPRRDHELVTARSEISQVVGSAVDEAALPLGRYDRRLLIELRRLRYDHVHSSDRRWARPHAWMQPRFSVREGDTVDSLRTEIFNRPAPVREVMLELRGLAKSLR